MFGFFWNACNNGAFLFQYYIERYDINNPDRGFIHRFVRNGSQWGIDKYISSGGDVNLIDSHGRHCLSYAFETNYDDVIKYLLAQEKCIFHSSIDDNLVTEFVIRTINSEDLQTLDLLMDRGFKLFEKLPENNLSYDLKTIKIIKAISAKEGEIIQWFQKQAIDDGDVKKLLHFATEKHDNPFYHLLIIRDPEEALDSLFIYNNIDAFGISGINQFILDELMSNANGKLNNLSEKIFKLSANKALSFKALSEYNADLKSVIIDKKSLLKYSYENNYSDLVELFLTELGHKFQPSECPGLLSKAIENYNNKIFNAVINQLQENKALDVEEVYLNTTPIFHAVKKENIHQVNTLIALGANLKHIDADGNIPLYYAIKNNNDKLIDLLMDQYHTPTHKNKKGDFLIHTAARYSLHALKKLLSLSYNATEKNKNQESALSITLCNNNLIAATEIIKADPTAKLSTIQQKEVLNTGVLNNYSKSFFYYLKANKFVDFSMLYDKNKSYLGHALELRNYNAAEGLFNNGTKLLSSEDINVYLINALKWRENLKVIKWIVESFSVNIKNALELAFNKYSDEEIVKYLMDKEPKWAQYSYLEIAIEKNWIDVIEKFINRLDKTILNTPLPNGYSGVYYMLSKFSNKKDVLRILDLLSKKDVRFDVVENKIGMYIFEALCQDETKLELLKALLSSQFNFRLNLNAFLKTPPLESIIKFDDIEIIKLYKNANGNLNVTFASTGLTAFETLLSEGKTEQVCLFLSFGVLPYVCKEHTALYYALAEQKNSELANILLDYGARANEPDYKTAVFPIEYALKFLLEGALKKLIYKGASFEDCKGHSAIYYILNSYNSFLRPNANTLRTLKFALDNGLNINKIDKELSMHPLEYALTRRWTDIIEIILSSKKTNVDKWSKQPYLQYMLNDAEFSKALQQGDANYLNILKKFLDAKIDVNALDNTNMPYIYSVIKLGNLEVVKLFAEHGANLSEVYNDQTPLILACKSGKSAIAQYLIEKGVPITSDSEGATAYHYAAQNDMNNVLKAAKANFVNYRDKKGDTPIHYWAKSKNPKTSVLETLLPNKTKYLDIQNKFFEDPLKIYICNSNANVYTLQILIDKLGISSLNNEQQKTYWWFCTSSDKNINYECKNYIQKICDKLNEVNSTEPSAPSDFYLNPSAPTFHSDETYNPYKVEHGHD